MPRHPSRQSTTIMMAALLAAAGALAGDASLPARQVIHAPQAPRLLTGRLSRVGGLRVLELWGTPEQAGYAQGFLLASDIANLIDGYVLDENILPAPETYETTLLPNVRRMFAWPDLAVQELRGMLAGARDRLGGDRFRSAKLDRPLQLEDLMVANTVADWFGFLCSSVTLWGDLTADRRILTGRNLDFPYTASMKAAQIVVLRAGGKHRWAGVSWPGLIGVYTGFSDVGVSMLIHDARGLPASASLGFTPRSLILREALEQADAKTYLDDVAAVFAARRVMVGNNIHVSGPDTARPAGVFEYDGNARGAGVTLRVAGDLLDAPPNAVWCTNHMCVRRAGQHHWRYNRIGHKLEHAARFAQPLDVDRLFELMASVQQSITLHTVVLEPQTRRMHVLIPAVSPQRVTFDLDQWLAALPPAPQAGASNAAAAAEAQP